jgi:hypothetical protein
LGLFDAIGNLFGIGSSGVDAAERARQQNLATLGTYGSTVNPLYQQYGTQALGALGQGQQAALESLRGGLQQQIGAYQQGLTGATAAGQAGVAGFDPLRAVTAGYDPAVSAYYGALGIKGPEETARAQGMFTTSPGYEFQQKEAADRAMARASQLGQLGSGNTSDALTRLASGLAGQEYGNWLNRLGAFVPLQQQGYTALGQGLAGANRTLADIYSGGYGQIGQAYGAGGQQQGALQYGYGQDVGNIWGNLTAGQAQTARDVAQGTMAGTNAVMNAQQQQAANAAAFWGNLIGGGTKAALGGGGLGALGSTLGSAAARPFLPQQGWGSY